jgi:hypothetical protein
MPSSRSLPSRARRCLARHLSRLADSFETLTSRLREGLASAIGQAAGEATREAVHAALEPGSGYRPSYPAPRQYDSPDAYWQEPGEPTWGEYVPDYWNPEDDSSPGVSGNNRDPPSCLPQTIAAGLHVAAWWLRRGSGRHVVLTAVGVGLFAVLVFWLSPLPTVGTGLVVSALTLVGLLDAMQAGAAFGLVDVD